MCIRDSVNRAAFNERFEILNELYRYWWKRTAKEAEHYDIVIDPPSLNYLSNFYDDQSASSIQMGTVSLSGGNIVFTPTSTISVSYRTYTNANELKGKYFKIANDGPYFMAENAPDASRGRSGERYYVQATFSNVSVEYTEAVIGNVDFVSSSNRSAYPDSGIINGYEYQYLGIPFENAREVPKIEVGSYLGTGTFGSTSPNTLTFSFTPIIWGVFRRVSTGGVDNPVPNIMLWDNNYQNMNVSVFTGVDSTTTHYITINGNSVSWYSSSSGEHQLNAKGTTYHYFAIG